ncbi:helix-turn-helix domain-containing protein [Bacillaceae bacterium S4-13-58]
MALTYEKIGQKLKEARKAAGFTQDQVANYLGIKRENLSYYETGTRQIDTLTLNKLAELYGYSLMYFLKPDSVVEEAGVATAFRASGLSNEDLKVVTWARKFAQNLDSLSELLEEE